VPGQQQQHMSIAAARAPITRATVLLVFLAVAAAFLEQLFSFAPLWPTRPHKSSPSRLSLQSIAIELSPVPTEFPRALVRSAHIDEDAVETACASLVKSVLDGNIYQFEALTTILRSMMPPTSGASKIRGPPAEVNIERSNLVWTAEDYVEGPMGNLRQLQGHEAELARCAAYATDGFRDSKVLGGALDLAGTYLKNDMYEKADHLFTSIEPYCMERGLPWAALWLEDCAALRTKQGRHDEAANLLDRAAILKPPQLALQ